MDRTNEVLEKLLDKTAKKETFWMDYLFYPDSYHIPYQNDPRIIPEESYTLDYSSSDATMGSMFFLVTLKEQLQDDRLSKKLIFGFSKHDGKDFVILSEDQKILFELKALIEYEEPEKEISDILDDFLNDEY